MHKFVRSLITEWRRLGLPVEGAAIVVAVSGGADSMSLLLAIADLVKRKKLQLDVTVAHLNHKLRGRESDADEKFVNSVATQLGLNFVSASASISRKKNLEQNARDARYKFLSIVAREENAFAVLTAHTQNDQAETLLMNLVRGSGTDGLSGMPSVRELESNVQLIRPLLSWASREDTENFCRDSGVKYRRDRMNDDDAFTRVRIRKTIIPELRKMNPRIVETLARTAELMRRGEGEKGRAGEGELVLSELKRLEKPELYEVLRTWLRGTRGNLRGVQWKHIEAIERLIFSPKSGKTAEIPGGGRVVKGGGRLRFEKIKVDK